MQFFKKGPSNQGEHSREQSMLDEEGNVIHLVTKEELEEELTYEELDEARVEGTIDDFNYTTLLYNLDKAKKELKFVTGKYNIMELERKIQLLEMLLKEHSTYKKIITEEYHNYEGGMSFTEDQRFLINIINGTYSHINDYTSYLTLKDFVEKHKSLSLENVITDHDKRRTIPDKYKNMNLGLLFAELFPQVDEDKQIPFDFEREETK